LGDKIKNVRGVGFTHLHIDHTEGVKEFCERHGAGAKVYQTVAQATVHNLHTKEGAQLVHDSCLEPVVIEGEGIKPLKEFPGLAMLHVGGHTPCSTIFFVTVGDKLWVLSGDVSNDKQDLLNNRGKGFVYSYLIVPENTRQLEKLRVWLASLDAQKNIEVIVSHDADALAKSEILKM
jgi:glyoxylase-like metal-dependent hydrolase (beta-lactamase superfamily II)